MKKNTKILVSIIIPVYNYEKYLPCCLESVLRQSYKTIEVILVDDGSADGSGRICDAYAKRDARVAVIHQKNSGASAARKNGFQHSKGEYIGFVDSDDYIEDNYIESLLTDGIQTQSDIVCCNFAYDGEGEKCVHLSKGCIISDRRRLFDFYFQKYGFAYVLWAKLFRRWIFEKLEFISLKYGEDTYMMLTAFQLPAQWSLLPYVGYHYRIHSGSLMGKEEENLAESCSDALFRAQYLLLICKELGGKYRRRAEQDMIRNLAYAVLALFKCDFYHWEKSDKLKRPVILAYYGELQLPWYRFISREGLVVLLYRFAPRLAQSLLWLWYSLKKYR